MRAVGSEWTLFLSFNAFTTITWLVMCAAWPSYLSLHVVQWKRWRLTGSGSSGLQQGVICSWKCMHARIGWRKGKHVRHLKWMQEKVTVIILLCTRRRKTSHFVHNCFGKCWLVSPKMSACFRFSLFIHNINLSDWSSMLEPSQQSQFLMCPLGKFLFWPTSTRQHLIYMLHHSWQALHSCTQARLNRWYHQN